MVDVGLFCVEFGELVELCFVFVWCKLVCDEVAHVCGDVFGVHGALGLMEEVVERVGVGIVTVFWYFLIKEVLIEVVLLCHFEWFNELVVEFGAQVDLVGALRWLLFRMIDIGVMKLMLVLFVGLFLVCVFVVVVDFCVSMCVIFERV